MATAQQQRKRRKRQQPVTRPTTPPTAPAPTAPVPPVQQVLSQVASRVAGVLAQHLAASLAFQAIEEILWPLGATAIAALALTLVLRILDRYPAPELEGIGAAQRYTIRMNELRRAAYLVNAVHRVVGEVLRARARGVPLEQASQQAYALEDRYFAQHVTASNQRMHAATKIDALNERYGPVLGWYARHDKKTTPECLAADGRNFWASVPPAIGWPGMVHVACRCYPGKPHRRGAMLP